jgi:ABC-2 type transport system permease protein
LASTPDWIQIVSYIIAARYFIEILKTLFLVGNVWSIILPNVAALFLMASILLILSRMLTHKHLE